MRPSFWRATSAGRTLAMMSLLCAIKSAFASPVKPN
jgi:hypothetical protein